MSNERLDPWILSPQEIKEITSKKERPLSPSQLIEFLVCSGCWYDHRHHGRVPPETSEQSVVKILHDMSFRIHRSLGKEGLYFRSPRKTINFFRWDYPQSLQARGEKKLLGFLTSSDFEPFSDEVKAQLLVYYLLNQKSILEAREKKYQTTLGEGKKAFDILAYLDQVRKVKIGEKETKAGKKRNIYKREIWELKKTVWKDAFFYYSIQTGIEFLVYQAKWRRRIPPQIIVYDFSTGDRYYRHGGEESLLVEGIILAKEAMDLGYNWVDPKHNHYPGFVKRPEKYMAFLRGFGATAEEKVKNELGKEKFDAAWAKLKAYAKGCSWKKHKSPCRIELDGSQTKVFCGDHGGCGGELYFDIEGFKCCSVCGLLD